MSFKRYESQMGSVFRIEVSPYRGSDFVVAENTLVTSWHIAERIEYGGKDGIIHIQEEPANCHVSMFRGSEAEFKSKDYAILHIDNATLKSDYYFKFGDSDSVTLGDKVYFIGYPFSSENTSLAFGHIAAVLNNHPMFPGIKVFQIDGNINKGNSGGPLLNQSGEVIGIICGRWGKLPDLLKSVMNTLNIQQENNNMMTQIYVNIGGGEDYNTTLLELLKVFDKYISVGIGYAIVGNYIREHLQKNLCLE